MVAAVIGEGGSGGAIALATGNRVLMYEHAIYCVISPEGCASILWRSAEHAQEAAEAGRITSDWMKKLGVVDAVVAEPLGGAHRNPTAAIDALGEAFDLQLQSMAGMDAAALIADRHNKYLRVGESGLA
jgi:acetyl-CoA carboxylase carboxyl transferase subunit alpha